MKKNPDSTEMLFNHIAFLEDTNDRLVNTLKRCHTLLRQLTNEVSDPDGWTELLNDLQRVITAGERSTGKRAVH